MDPKPSLGKGLKWALFLGRDRTQLLTQTKVSRLRVIIGAVLAIAFATTAYYGNSIPKAAVNFVQNPLIHNWVNYSSEEGSFTVAFPTEPELEEKALEVPSADQTINYNEYTSYEKKKISYSVSFLELPSKWRFYSSKLLLRGALGLIVDNTPGAKLVSKEFGYHGEFPVLNFKTKEGDNEVQGRLILVGSTLYKMTVVYPPEKESELKHLPFFDSFQRTP